MSKTLTWRKSVVVYFTPKVRAGERMENSQVNRRRLRRNSNILLEGVPDIQENDKKDSIPLKAIEEARKRRMYRSKRMASRRRRMSDREKIDDSVSIGSGEKNQSEKKVPEENVKKEPNQRQKPVDQPTTNRRKGPLANVKARIDSGINKAPDKSVKKTSSYILIDSKSNESHESDSIHANSEPKEQKSECLKTEICATPVKERKAPSPYETERQIDYLVTSLACMMPACRNEVQINSLVRYFAEAFRHKVVAVSIKDRAKTAASKRLLDEVEIKGSTRKPVETEGMMEKTAAWVAQCAEITEPCLPDEKLKPKTFNKDEKRHPEGSQTFRKQKLMRNYGEMCLLRESGDSIGKNDSDKEEIPEEIEECSNTPPPKPVVRYTITNPDKRQIRRTSGLHRRK